MAVKYLAGDRIQGTAAERATLPTAAIYDVGAWKEIGRASATNNSTQNIACALDPVCPYLMILCSHTPYNQTNTDPALRFNTDTGTNYVRKRSQNHAAYDSANQSALVIHGGTSACPEFDVAFVTNTSASQEKMAVIHGFNGKGNNSDQAGVTAEVYGKWTNTSALISTVNLYNVQGGTPVFKSGSEIVVLGFDPDDTTGAVSKWVELADVTLGSDGDILSTGTFTSKKYMLMEAHIERADSNSIVPHMIINGDSGANYTRIRSGNGGSPAYNTGQNEIDCSEGDNSVNQYYTYWINNVSAEAKMIIGHTTGDDTGTTAPSRKEIMGKWNNTAGLITSIDLRNNDGSGNFKAGSKITVWGFD